MKKVVPVAVVLGVLSLVACGTLAGCSVETYVMQVHGAGTIQNLIGAVFTWNDAIYQDNLYFNYSFAFRSGTSSFALWTSMQGSYPPRGSETITYFADSSSTVVYEISWASSEYKVISVLSNPEIPSDLYTDLSSYGTWDLTGVDDPYEVPSTSSSASSSVPTYSEGYSDGYSAGYSDGASEGSSAGYSNGYADGASEGSSAGYSNGYADGASEGSSAGYSNGYADGLADGSDYSAGYSAGYSEGLLDATFDIQQGIYVQWDTSSSSSRTIDVVWLSDDGTISGTQALSYYNPTIYFERPSSSVVSLTISSSSNIPFNVTYSAVNTVYTQVVSYDTYVGGKCYLPTWEGSITLTVDPEPDTSSQISTYDFVLDPSKVSSVRVSNGYAAGYNDGRVDGYSSGYVAGNSAGYSAGNEHGYNQGQSAGYSEGYNAGLNAVDEGGQVLNNIFGAIVGVPISVLNGLAPLTIWSVPLISIFLSFLFLAIVLWILRKFI